MENSEILFSRFSELKERAEDNSMITSTSFLTFEERSMLLQREKKKSPFVSLHFFGGYKEAERTVAVFVPCFYEPEDIHSFFSANTEECPVALIRLRKDKFTPMGHRDYLGSLMALGIKREVLGDIIVTDDGCFFFCLKSMAEFITENLTKAARGSVSCSQVPLSSFENISDNGKELFCSVASLRLDSVLAGAFSLSRSAACEYISRSLVYVNGLLCLKNDYPLKKGDKIVLRGKGKAVVEDFAGVSKKGKTRLIIKKFE